MISNTLKILFLHGLDSSKESSKFHALNCEKKFCINVDYRNLSYQSVFQFYQEIIEKIRPDILVGHSLGAYWALKMSFCFKIPTIIANPSLQPNFRDDYPPITHDELENDIPQIAYLELGDEIINMYHIQEQLEPYMQVQSVEGGHHRLMNPDNINILIEYIQENFIFK